MALGQCQQSQACRRAKSHVQLLSTWATSSMFRYFGDIGAIQSVPLSG
jgi:hypothetical protein